MRPEGELVGRLWRIVFFRAGDRIAHRVEMTGGGCEPLLESAEGSPDEPWPASPALQQVHFQPGADGRQMALLVGMAGRSHWSASVEVSESGSQAVFEVACRAKSPPQRLGVSYRVLGRHRVELAGSLSPAQTGEPDAAGVLIGPVALAIAPIAQSPAAEWIVHPEQVRLAVLPALDTWPQTISWRYVLQAQG